MSNEFHEEGFEITTSDELDNIKFYVGKAMVEFPCFRTHEHRDDLVKWVRSQGVECSSESISRCQRKLWSIALDELDKGNFDYAFKFLPSNRKDFEKWCERRKVDAEIYRKYFGRLD